MGGADREIATKVHCLHLHTYFSVLVSHLCHSLYVDIDFIYYCVFFLDSVCLRLLLHLDVSWFVNVTVSCVCVTPRRLKTRCLFLCFSVSFYAHPNHAHLCVSLIVSSVSVNVSIYWQPRCPFVSLSFSPSPLPCPFNCVLCLCQCVTYWPPLCLCLSHPHSLHAHLIVSSVSVSVSPTGHLSVSVCLTLTPSMPI